VATMADILCDLRSQMIKVIIQFLHRTDACQFPIRIHGLPQFSE